MLPVERPCRRVLVLSYEFPPLLSGGVVRIHAFVKYLPAAGYVPYVLTVDERWYEKAEFDVSLLKQYRDDVRIVRTPSLMLRGQMVRSVRTSVLGLDRQHAGFAAVLKGLLKNLYRLACVPDETMLWWPFALWAGMGAIRSWRPDIILATTPPHGTGVVAALLSRLTNVPFVLDVRDNWAGNPFYVVGGRWRRWIETRLERCVVDAASHIVVVTEESQRLLRRHYPGRDSTFFQLIPNGFDPELFAEMGTIKPVHPGQWLPRKARVRITYAGGVWLKRSPEGLLRALQKLKQHSSLDLQNELEVIFIGHMRPEFLTMIEEMGLADIVNYRGFFQQKEALDLLRTSDVGLVIIPKDEGAETAIPGKVYEYMAAGIYILALADPDTAIGRLIMDFGLGEVVPQFDADAIATALRHILGRSQNNSLTLNRQPETLARFNRAEHARRLAQIFDEILGLTL